MLNLAQIEKIEAMNGKNIRWRVEASRDAQHRTDWVKLILIRMGSTASVMAEQNRICRDMYHEEQRRIYRIAAPDLLIGIYTSDVDPDMIDEDIAVYLEVQDK